MAKQICMITKHQMKPMQYAEKMQYAVPPPLFKF